MELLLQTLVISVSNVAIYVILGVGVSMIFGVADVVNFAHGDFMTIAAYVALTTVIGLSVSPLLAILAVLPAMVVLGLLFHRFILRPMRRHTHEMVVVGTFGLAILLQGVVAVVWGASPRGVRRNVQALDLSGIAIPHVTIINVVMAVTALSALWWVLMRTQWGREMRATAQDRIGAQLIGVNTERAEQAAVVVAVVLTGLAGIMIVQRSELTPQVGFGLVLKAFAVAIVGGLGRVTGVLYAGALLGVAEGLVGTYGSASLANVVIFGAVVVTLLIRPSGIVSMEVRA